jgi:hypothetical protein
MFEYHPHFQLNKAFLVGLEYFHNEMHIMSMDSWSKENWLIWIHIGPLSFGIEKQRR